MQSPHTIRSGDAMHAPAPRSSTLAALLICAALATPVVRAQDDAGEVIAWQQIATSTYAGFGADLLGSWFGTSVVAIDDLDGNGYRELAVGASKASHAGQPIRQGGVWILFMNASGVSSHVKIAPGSGGFTGTLAQDDLFGSALATVGDLDGNGVTDIAVGAFGADDGCTPMGAAGPGAVWLLRLDSTGNVISHSRISNGNSGLPANTLACDDAFGSSVICVGDLDLDGNDDLVVGAQGTHTINGDLDAGAIYVLFMDASANVSSLQMITEGMGGFTHDLMTDDLFGNSLAHLGDVNGDGTDDIAVGADYDNGGAVGRGAVYIIFLTPAGTVGSDEVIGKDEGGFTAPLAPADFFGSSVASLGDLNGDGITELAAGAFGDDWDFGRGAFYVLSLHKDGSVKSHVRVASNTGGFGGALTSSGWFGFSAANIGDWDGDGVVDLLVGEPHSNDSFLFQSGAAWVLSLTDGPWSDLGNGKPGTGGITPSLTGSGTLAGGTSVTLTLADAVPNASAFLFIGFGFLGAPLQNGVLVPTPDILIQNLPTGPTGSLPLTAPWPGGVPPGFRFFFQYWISDPGAGGGSAASNGLTGLTP